MFVDRKNLEKALSSYPQTALMTHPRNDGVLAGHHLMLATDHSPGLLHIVFQQAVVEHASVMNIHIPFFIWDQNTVMCGFEVYVHIFNTHICVHSLYTYIQSWGGRGGKRDLPPPPPLKLPHMQPHVLLCMSYPLKISIMCGLPPLSSFLK